MPFSQKASTHSTTYRHLIRAASIGLIAIGASLIPVLPADASPAPAGTHAHGGFGNGAGGNRGRYGNAGGQGGASGYGNGRSSHANAGASDPDVKPRGYKAKQTLGPDGLGIKPGQDQARVADHPREQVVRRDASPASTTTPTCGRRCPSQGVLLKNYYGTGHFSLDNYSRWSAARRPSPDTQADCPYYDAIRGHGRHVGHAHHQPELRAVRSAAGPNAAAGHQRLRVPGDRADAVQPARRGGCELEGLRPGPERHQHPHRDEQHLPPTAPAPQYCGAPYATPGPTGSTRQPNPGQRQRHRPVRAQALPLPVVRVDPAVGRLQLRRTSPTCSTRPTASTTTCRAQATTPAFSWISPNNCSDGHDAVCHGNNLSGGFSGPTTPNAPVNYTGGLYAGRPVPGARRPRDRGLAGVQGRRSHRHHLRRGLPAFTYTGNSFANSTIVPPNAATSIARRHRRRDAVRPDRALGADGPEHAAGDRTPTANSSTRAPATTPTSTVRPTASPRRCRRSPRAPASSAAASHVRGVAQRTDADSGGARSGSTTIADNSIVATDDRSYRHRRAASRRGPSSGTVTDTPSTRPRPTRAAASSTPARSCWSTPPASRSPPPARSAAITLGARDAGERPAVRRHDADQRRRRHGQRADQPLHQAGHREQRCTTTTTAGCGRWRTCSTSSRPPRAWTGWATSATPPSPGSHRSALTCSTTRPGGTRAMGVRR